MKAYWMKGTNFGDAMTPYIIGKLSGQQVNYFDPLKNPKTNDKIVSATGSIMSCKEIESCHVWGNGFAWDNEKFYKPKRIHAVRGMLTADKIYKTTKGVVEVFGDPALLLPLIWKPTPEKQYKVGIIPHVIDYQRVVSKYWRMHNRGVKVINLNDPIEKVIFEINQCEVAFSSSLHGLIVSHAYKVPCSWVEFSDKVLGDGMKFNDYFSSVKIHSYKPINARSLPDIDILMKGLHTDTGTYNPLPLLKAAPFELNDKFKAIANGTN